MCPSGNQDFSFFGAIRNIEKINTNQAAGILTVVLLLSRQALTSDIQFDNQFSGSETEEYERNCIKGYQSFKGKDCLFYFIIAKTFQSVLGTVQALRTY